MIPVTLLVPCYNAARYLPRLMECVRAMTTPFTAIIAYDDGSSDDTVAVARTLGVDIITLNKNSGVAAARNRLAAAASTEWIHFHDADDLIHPEFLTHLSPFAAATADVVSCDADWINECDRGLQIAWRYEPDALISDAATYLLAHPLGLNNSLIRRSSWISVGGCDETLAMWEDADVHLRLALAGAHWKHVPEVLTWSLRNPASFSHDYRRNWNCRLQSLQKYATLPTAARLSYHIADEAEKTARELLALGDRSSAKQALDLAIKLGRTVPTTKNPLLRVVRALLPPIVALDLQRLLRS